MKPRTLFSLSLLILTCLLVQNVSAQDIRQTFEDSFDDNSNDWNLGTFNSGVFSVIDGELSITSETPGRAVVIRVPSPSPFDSFGLSVDMRTGTRGSPSYDVWFNSEHNASSALVVSLTPDSQEIGLTIIRDNQVVSSDTVKQRSIRKSGTNTLGMSYIKDVVIIISINGVQMSPINIEGLTEDLLGETILLGVSSNEDDVSPVQGYFDNLKIQHIEFRDQFSNNNNGWRLDRTSTGYGEIIDDQLVLTATQSNTYKALRLPSLLYFDQFTITFSAIAPENTSSIYSIWLRADEQTLNGAEVSISPERQAVMCSTRQNGEYQSGGWLDAPMLNQNGENTFLLRVSPIAVLIEINGQLYPQACFLAPENEYFGNIFFAVAGSADGAISVHFDDLLISSY